MRDRVYLAVLPVQWSPAVHMALAPLRPLWRLRECAAHTHDSAPRLSGLCSLPLPLSSCLSRYANHKSEKSAQPISQRPRSSWITDHLSPQTVVERISLSRYTRNLLLGDLHLGPIC